MSLSSMRPGVRQALLERRRWYVLDALAQMADRTLSEDIIGVAVRSLGMPMGAEEIRADLTHLEQQGCVRNSLIPTGPGVQVWVATLTREGLQVRDCERDVPGVSSHRPL